jgi:hypothetical protein
MNSKTTGMLLAMAGCELAVTLASIIIRAGARDSLDWWDDEAMTPEGDIVLGRLFPRSTRRLARRLAALAAQERQAGLLGALRSSVVTLLDLQPEAFEAMTVPDEPITNEEDLRARLAQHAPAVVDVRLPGAAVGALFDLTPAMQPLKQSAEDLAVLLASGYLHGRRGRPVIPYIRAGPVEAA